MNKTVMCVTVCGNTTNIGLYDVELGNNSIRYLNLRGYQTKADLKVSEISELIFKMQSQILLDLIIIDSRAMVIAVADELESKKCSAPIYKAYITRQVMSNSLVELHMLIKENMIDVDKNINIDLDSFNITYDSDNTNITLLKSDYDNAFSNICMLLGFGGSVLSDIFKIDKREKIETNLNEILRILVDDLHNLKSPEQKEIEKLARLIDKINYIRGQY